VDGTGVLGALKWLAACSVCQPRALIVHIGITLLFTYVIAAVYAVPVILVLFLTGYANSAEEPIDWSDLLPLPSMARDSAPDVSLGQGSDFNFGFEPIRKSERRPAPSRTINRPNAQSSSHSTSAAFASGNWLRLICIAVIILTCLAYLGAYWIVSLTGFYERARLAVNSAGP